MYPRKKISVFTALVKRRGRLRSSLVGLVTRRSAAVWWPTLTLVVPSSAAGSCRTRRSADRCRSAVGGASRWPPLFCGVWRHRECNDEWLASECWRQGQGSVLVRARTTDVHRWRQNAAVGGQTDYWTRGQQSLTDLRTTVFHVLHGQKINGLDLKTDVKLKNLRRFRWVKVREGKTKGYASGRNRFKSAPHCIIRISINRLVKSDPTDKLKTSLKCAWSCRKARADLFPFDVSVDCT